MDDPTRVAALSLHDFRCFGALDVELGPGLTVVLGRNGEGKTSLLEAVGWVGSGRSFRGVADGALVRSGADAAVIRAHVEGGGRRRRLEAEIRAGGRNRILVDGRAVRRARDLTGLLRTTVFTPDDLQLVKGGPGERRTYLDDLLGTIAPRYDAARSDYERVLKQRNALLRTGARDAEARATLDVLDVQLVRAGAELLRGRLGLVDQVVEPAADAYARLAGEEVMLRARYLADWSDVPLSAADRDDVEERLGAALAARRGRDVERGLSLVGPHRDEWHLALGGLDARLHASQGEQRTLSLALRLAGHLVVREITGDTPVLLLDDVFSELDARRGRALVDELPSGQALLSTTDRVPDAVRPERVLRLAGHRLVDVA